MPLGKRPFYGSLVAACLAGYAWLSVHYTSSAYLGEGVAVCLIKKVTHIPCPSCGATRAVLLLLHGDLTAAFYCNPLGLFIFCILVIAPPWLGYDLARKKESLFRFYHSGEAALRQKKIAIPLVLLLLGNWIWNVYKDL